MMVRGHTAKNPAMYLEMVRSHTAKNPAMHLKMVGGHTAKNPAMQRRTAKIQRPPVRRLNHMLCSRRKKENESLDDETTPRPKHTKNG